ncbi:hypothetical protein AGDE_15312 [Angomonas deanei]|uniref:Phosphoinositide phospholipase C n=1 Tax=Angomonas deanei TaxID=59799 RepID=A0A7G2C4P5_9TRYP|nr:hypothetical protein AGDE_15312 [Angomonas deanei]CAD2213717.1 Phosphatidylinositol-specific phospholipase C, Y domain containing protein, putative [Angomonas deanei]|eukprot:EPY19290.1 hypothetical protein AGDE_15312 [Angomonas deanei]
MDREEDEEVNPAIKDKEYIKMMEEGKKEPRCELIDRLSALVALEGAGFKGVKDIAYLKDRQPYQVSSLTEKKANAAVKGNNENFIKLNGACLTRVYPTSSRVDSNNYDPCPFWNAGCQLVAMNYQGNACPEFKTYKTYFMDNGRCGYVLKPAPLRPPYAAPQAGKSKRNITIEVISAFCLPKSQKNEESRRRRETASVHGKRGRREKETRRGRRGGTERSQKEDGPRRESVCARPWGGGEASHHQELSQQHGVPPRLARPRRQ